ncbi:MAG TPA: hypothetical protein VIV60_01805 [Polyangiaceae bacterium]
MLKLIHNRADAPPLSPIKHPADELRIIVEAAAKGDARATLASGPSRLADSK